MVLAWRCGFAFALVVCIQPLSVRGGESDTIDPPSIPLEEELAHRSHPLQWTIRYAEAHLAFIRQSIRDYSCRLVKRERIDGELQDHQFARLKVRCQMKSDDEVTQPLSVFMQYLAPARLKDRRVLFIADQNDGRVLVRKGGSLMRHVKVSVDPNGRSARRESNYPITDVGFDKITERLIDRVRMDMEIDPTGENTEVEHFKNAKIDDRLCTHIRVVHPDPADGLTFHIASLYIDDDLHVPTRLLVYGWPENEKEDPPLNEEYTYVNLELNVGLTADDFSEDRLSPDRGR